jgi:glycosyltransferase involved in cell wall biosynthesis
MNEFASLNKWIAKVDPDIIIAFRTTSYGFFAALSGFKPYVVAAQGETDAWPLNSFLRPVKLLFGRIAVKRAALIHAWSPNMAEGLLEMHADPSKILVRPRGILLDNFPYCPSPIHLPLLKAVVTRSLYKEYQIDKVIQAIAQINLDSTSPFKITLAIAGSGPERFSLQKLIYELKQESFIYLIGKVENAKLKDIFGNTHFYISMPETEGASASLFEAFSSGLFPIVSDLAANRIWVKDGVNGYLVDKNNISDLRSKIIQLRKKQILTNQQQQQQQQQQHQQQQQQQQ